MWMDMEEREFSLFHRFFYFFSQSFDFFSEFFTFTQDFDFNLLKSKVRIVILKELLFSNGSLPPL